MLGRKKESRIIFLPNIFLPFLIPCDDHLQRARLFRDKVELDKARGLIEKHGYWQELEDAEAAATGS